MNKIIKASGAILVAAEWLGKTLVAGARFVHFAAIELVHRSLDVRATRATKRTDTARLGVAAAEQYLDAMRMRERKELAEVNTGRAALYNEAARVALNS